MNVIFSNPTFLIMGNRNFNCLFSISFLLILCHLSYGQSMSFSVSISRTTFRLSHVSYYVYYARYTDPHLFVRGLIMNVKWQQKHGVVLVLFFKITSFYTYILNNLPEIVPRAYRTTGITQIVSLQIISNH